jgi:hypothetical protein
LLPEKSNVRLAHVPRRRSTCVASFPANRTAQLRCRIVCDDCRGTGDPPAGERDIEDPGVAGDVGGELVGPVLHGETSYQESQLGATAPLRERAVRVGIRGHPPRPKGDLACLLSDGPTALDDPNEDRNDREHEQQVDETTRRKVEREAEYPQHDENDGDRPQ